MERVAGRGRRCECGERCSFLENFETKGPVEVPTTTSTSLHLRRSSASDAVFSMFPPSPSLSVFHTPACGPDREDEDKTSGGGETRIGRGGGKHVGLKARSGHHASRAGFITTPLRSCRSMLASCMLPAPM